MNRMLTVSCLAGILVSAIAIGAQASQDNWNVKFQGGTAFTTIPTDSAGAAFAFSSTLAGIVDDTSVLDPKDGKTTPSAMQPVVATAWYRPAWTKNDPTDNQAAPWAFQQDYRTPLTNAPQYIKVWEDLVLWTTFGWNATENPTINLYVTPATGANAPPTAINGQPIIFKVVMTQSPAGYDGPREWTINSSGMTTIGPLTSVGTSASNPISGSGPLAATQNAGYRFNFVTPEPGSILALGAGLVGFAGLLRRRS
ncbi:MAG: PEP-CTERM sorting domain-containing protein [Armatimonadetes bacterium]|nr:PEP-CTERM sorting domain-containing protein [Armatimonadota bacterium]